MLCCAVRICCSGQTSPHGGVKRMPSGVTPAQKRYDVCGQLSLRERLPGPAHALTRASAQTFPAAKRFLRADNRHRCGAAQRRVRFSGVRSEAVCGRRSCRWPRLPSDHSSYVRRPAAGRHCSHFGHHSPTYVMDAEHVFACTHSVPASCRHYRPLVILEAQPGRAPPLCHSPSSFAELPQSHSRPSLQQARRRTVQCGLSH